MYQALVDHIADSLSQAGGEMVTVTIDGFSGAGKTSLGERLVREFHGRDVAVLFVEMELWARGWGDLEVAVHRVKELAEELRDGPATTRTWNWWTETLEEPITLSPKPLLLIVGSGSGQIPADIAVWLDCDRDTRQERVSERDPYDWSEHWDEWESQELRLLTNHDSREHATYRFSCEGNSATPTDHLSPVHQA